MAFIGNTSTTQSFAPAIDYFNGDGSTVAFTLSRPVASVAQVQVVVNNVAQNPSSAYSVSSNTITFTSAPSSGTSNIYVYYTSPITQIIQPAQGTIGKIQLDIASLNGTGALQLPTGTTAQRPTGATGLIRQNSTTGYPEWYDATTSNWVQFNQGIPYTISYLVVAGGGGGGGTNSGNSASGGGGAGGLLTSTVLLSTATTYTITVGAGGAGGTNAGSGGGPGAGTNSSLGALVTTIGGGGGASTFAAATSGGSGGGGRSGGAGAAGTSGQGFAGGSSANAAGGGGGGASAVGSAGASTTGGTGGAGTASSITGSSITYAGGGGGGANSGGTGGGGGAGGGGTGSTGSGSAGTANLGGGGGGCGDNSNGGAGGSGVVILSIPTANYTGVVTGSPTVTTSGSNTIVKFTSSGTYTA